MGHFAEIDSNNKVLRVVNACNQDIANNGGEQSEQAAEQFKSVTPLSNNGVRWVQTSYNNNFRKQYAGINCTFDPVKDVFILPQPYLSWSLDANNDWQAPVAYPTVTTDQDGNMYLITWDEPNLRWIGANLESNMFAWIPESSSWIPINN